LSLPRTKAGDRRRIGPPKPVIPPAVRRALRPFNRASPGCDQVSRAAPRGALVVGLGRRSTHVYDATTQRIGHNRNTLEADLGAGTEAHLSARHDDLGWARA